jgi:hypothetical protein
LGFECYEILKNSPKFHIELGFECYEILKNSPKFHIELGFACYGIKKALSKGESIPPLPTNMN